MTLNPYVQLIEVKRWADRGLYEAAAEALPRLAAQDASLMLLVLDHIQVVDRIFQHHLLGVPHGLTSARSPQIPAFEVLADNARALDDWYADYVWDLPPAAFGQVLEFAFTSGKPARMTRGDILQHVCLHGCYHRGNAGALLQLRGLTPSRDAVTDFLEDALEAAA